MYSWLYCLYIDMYDNPKKLLLPVWFVSRVSTETYDVKIGKH